MNKRLKREASVANELHDAPETPEDLLRLLDLSSLTSEVDISARFRDIAKALLLEYRICLRCGEVATEFDVLELEFYLYKPGCHEDPFTHGADEQKHSGNWYFHKVPRRSPLPPKPTASTSAAGGYRGGTRKGLDLTFGTPRPVRSPYFSADSSSRLSSPTEADIVGGILLRTIQRVSDGTVVSGPSLLVDEILRLSEASSIASLVKDKWNTDIFAFHPPSSASKFREADLYLHRRPISAHKDRPIVYTSPRVGLDLSNLETTDSLDHPRVMYMPKPYRYLTHPHLLTSNGRPQTLYGLYQGMSLLSDYAQDESRVAQELAKLTGLKQSSVVKYLSDYKQGYECGKLRSFIGAAGKGASSSPATYLRMMGTLRRMSGQEAIV
ncbi:hypothetical protein NEOLEDRAFT_1154003 [Neolentinus lepideus HHB14362 ss-1]|uniref:Uncharacterized protein n=1 Tax=Neolentinus lepideus HHB14362 ss-1 TaxID=1314782 RepID=A0A165VDY8_9AGAM|nr:hypothetical protein NEOLEDRAFT_1154003 [Neolentinus lepideus HHB14362 ss-1]